MIIDDNFKWRQHIENISITMSKSISITNKVCYIIDGKALYSLYCTLVLPYMMYACNIWGTNYNSRLACIICLQRKAIRIVCNGGYRDHTNEFFCSLKCLKRIDVLEFKCLLIMYKVRHNLLPRLLQTHFNEIDNSHMYYSRSLSKVNVHCVHA